MKIEPLDTLLLVKPDVVKDKTDGGLWIPPVAKDRKQLEGTTGVIIATGPAVTIESNGEDIKEGDCVMFAKWAGYVVEEAGVAYRIIDHKDVIARINA